MKEIYKFLVVSTGHKDKDLREKLRNIDEGAIFDYRSEKQNPALDLVQEMIDYNYKGIIVTGRVHASYTSKLFRYASENEVQEKIYTIQDDKFASLWDIAFGDKQCYAREEI